VNDTSKHTISINEILLAMQTYCIWIRAAHWIIQLLLSKRDAGRSIFLMRPQKINSKFSKTTTAIEQKRRLQHACIISFRATEMDSTCGAILLERPTPTTNDAEN